MVDELTPHAVFALVLEERGHHLLVAGKDARALGMIGWQVAQHFGHSRGKPTISSAPEEGDVLSMMEQAIWLLKFVEVRDHLGRVAIKIFAVAGGAVGLKLQDGKHVHVVDPVAGLGGEAVGLRILPLAIGP